MVLLPHTVRRCPNNVASGRPHEDSRTYRLLFKFVLKIFYGTIVVEGTENIPLKGEPWCVMKLSPPTPRNSLEAQHRLRQP